ncbi:bacteriocin [Companilactobacillus nantensis]|nr:bacteriocin [Companilactobacillus nantensis]GEO65240.1 hypothetical protein LNA01_24230 [Companilactobacillus nantensis]
MKKEISDKELKEIYGGRNRLLLGGFTSNGIIRNVVKWFKK